MQYLNSILENKGFEVSILDNWLNSSMTNADVYEAIMKRKDEICFVGTSSYMLSNAPTIELIKSLRKTRLIFFQVDMARRLNQRFS